MPKEPRPLDRREIRWARRALWRAIHEYIGVEPGQPCEFGDYCTPFTGRDGMCRSCQARNLVLLSNLASIREKPPTEHGLSRYTNEKCRCKVCRAANTRYYRERRAAAQVVAVSVAR